MTAIRLVVVDDHPTFVRALSVLLETDPEIDVVAVSPEESVTVPFTTCAAPSLVSATSDGQLTIG